MGESMSQDRLSKNIKRCRIISQFNITKNLKQKARITCILKQQFTKAQFQDIIVMVRD